MADAIGKKKLARIAGMLYLTVIVTGMVSLIFVPPGSA
jgi:hypothetical protein